MAPQLRMLLFSRPATAAPPALTSEASALFARMWTPPSAGRAQAIDGLISGFKQDGIWAKLTAFFDLAGETEQHSLLNWCRPFSAINNGCAYTPNAGVRPGNGPPNWVDLGFQADTFGVDSLTSTTAGVWTNADGGASGSVVMQLGTAGSGSRVRIVATQGANETYRVHDTGSHSGRVGGPSRVGHRTIVRADNTGKRFFFEGALTATATNVPTTALATGNFALFRADAVYNQLNDSICFAYVGAALTESEVSGLHNRLQGYRTAAAIL